MVGVARLPVGQNDDAGAEQAQDAHDFEAVFQGVFDRAVGQVESLPPAGAQQARGLRGFAGALFGAAAGSGLALGQVENGGAQAARGHAQQGSAAGLFHVVAVRGDGQNVGRWRIGQRSLCVIGDCSR